MAAQNDICDESASSTFCELYLLQGHRWVLETIQKRFHTAPTILELDHLTVSVTCGSAGTSPFGGYSLSRVLDTRSLDGRLRSRVRSTLCEWERARSPPSSMGSTSGTKRTFRVYGSSAPSTPIACSTFRFISIPTLSPTKNFRKTPNNSGYWMSGSTTLPVCAQT